jgi:hypothetical protein
MKNKPTTPAQPTPKPKTRPDDPAATNPLRQADLRWQRTVRYGWDNGGRSGGGKSGR